MVPSPSNSAVIAQADNASPRDGVESSENPPASDESLYAVPGAPVLPIELIELIIEHLRGQCGTLRNCVLAYRALYPRAMVVLYRAIWV